MKTLAILALILASAIAGAESKYILGVKRLSTSEIGISCANGGDPTGQTVGGTLIISCGK
jgi:hypothetical protein